MTQEVTSINSQDLFPFIVADNWYSPEEEKLIWKELDFYYKPGNLEHSAKKSAIKNGVALSDNWRIYLSDVLNKEHYNISSIMDCRKKFNYEPFKNFVKKSMPQGIQFNDTNKGSTVISYYDNNQKYDAHHDTTQFTTISWFYKEPRKFTGGDFWFTQSGVEVKCKHNRMVFFPSYYLHKVTPVLMNHQDKDQGLGRFSITNFFWNHQS